MQVSHETFYDESRIAIVPMGFCYPGKGQSGDLPPRKECAPHWHPQVLEYLNNIELVLLIGQYAMGRYLGAGFTTVTETVARWQEAGPKYFPLVHPSPRNQLWLRRNPWFEAEVIPELRQRVQGLL
jgi:uracil-DNA glycosylase